MSEPWKNICAGCHHLNAQEPRQHCYMFRDAPETNCAQHAEIMEKAKRDGKLVSLSEIPHVVLNEVSGSKK